MSPDVEQAVDEIRNTFSGHQVMVEEDGQGGALVIVDDIDIGTLYAPSTTWIGFHITFQYPRADVYPHYIDGAVSHVDGKPHGAGFSTRSWNGRSALQISRRSNHRNPVVDTAGTKLLKVIEWLQTQ